MPLVQYYYTGVEFGIQVFIMVKVSISLPNNAQITFESEEPEIIHEIVEMVLRDLPRDLMGAAPPVNGEIVVPSATEKGRSAENLAAAVIDQNTASATPRDAQSLAGDDSVTTQLADPHEAGKIAQPSAERTQETSTSGRIQAQQAARSAAAELAFIQFCQSVNPLGDMRKVVVATEGAARFLDMESVDAQELGRLFDRVGWLHPHNFTQTLRNAARSKFRWLERVPGRSGNYTVTSLGRTTTLND